MKTTIIITAFTNEDDVMNSHKRRSSCSAGKEDMASHKVTLYKKDVRGRGHENMPNFYDSHLSIY